MSKLLRKSKLSEDNSYHISQQKTNIDSLIATHAAIATAHHTKYTDAEAITAIETKEIPIRSNDAYLYDATYNFAFDLIGGDPNGWTIVEGGGTIGVIHSVDGHLKVVDINRTGAGIMTMSMTINEGFGSLEFYIETTDNNNRFLFGVNSAVGIMQYEIDNGNHRYWHGLFHDIEAINNNQMYKLRIDFETTVGGYLGLGEDEFNIWIDDVLKVTAEAFHAAAGNIILIKFQIIDANACHFYIDAIGFTWDGVYAIGDSGKKIYGLIQ